MSIKSNKAISLIALIITIIVIIILAAIVVSVGLNTPDKAATARFLGDITEIQHAVSMKRAENQKLNPDGTLTDKNTGFTKIMLKKTADGEFEDGWVVNLNTINVNNSTLGNGYGTVQTDDEITFGLTAPDVYVYDEKGQVFYAKGFYSSGTVAFSINEALNGGTEATPSEGNEGESEVVEPDNPTDWVFNSTTGVITQYNGLDVQELIIPNSINGTPVTGIAGSSGSMGMINESSNIPSIVVSSGITNIGNLAFYDFNGTSITLPEGVTSIGNYAFGRCMNLTAVVLPSTVTSIGNGAFWTSTKIASVNIPEGITAIPQQCFQACYALTEITLPSTIQTIDYLAFENCQNLTQINIPSGVTSIGSLALRRCFLLEQLTIPSSVTTIASDALQECISLTQITVNKAEDPDFGAPWGAPYATVTWNP